MRLRALAVALGLTCGAFAACTTFNGLSVGDTPLDEAGAVDASFDEKAPPADARDSGNASDAPSKQTSFLSIEDAVRVCTLAIQCPLLPKSVQASLAVPLDILNYSLCVDWLAGPLPPNRVGVTTEGNELACVAKGTTCTKALACISQEFLDDLDPRCAGFPLDGGRDAGFFQYCDDAGGVVRCDPQFFHDVLHCTSGYYMPGSKCTLGSDHTKSCATGTDCPSTSCSGNLLEFCGGNDTHQAENCAIEGLTCGFDVTDDSGVPTCLTTDRAVTCTAQGTDCAGNAVSVCDGFTRSQYDCAALGGTCTKASGTARCKRADDVCAPEDPSVNQCSGSNLSLCVGGHPTSFDCARVGMKCVPGGGSLSGHCG
jgi:hypothetical protein